MKPLTYAVPLLASMFLFDAAHAAGNCPSFSEVLSVVRNERVTGTVSARTAECKATVAYKVSDNGRGPVHDEQIEYGADALPRLYTITGKSAFGGPVDERFAQEDGRVRWKSQADQGEIADQQSRLYLANDFSPYSLAVYARALLAAPGGRLRTAPDGELSITRVGEHSLQGAGGSVRISYYRIDGRDVSPDYVAFDDQQHLFATRIPEAFAIRTGWENSATQVRAELDKLEKQRLEALQTRLAHPLPQLFRIRNVRIFNAATGSLGPLSDVLVKGDRISSIAPASSRVPRPGAELDGAGGVLVPGLHDMHAHLYMDDGLPYIAAGVTTVRDMGNRNQLLHQLILDIQAGRLAGPDVVANGFIEGKSAYSANSGIIVDTLDAALKAVNWYADRGYWQIKLYNSFNPQWVKPVADLAHKRGMGVTGHVPAFATPDAMIEAGYDEIAHLNQLTLGWLLKPGEDTRTTLRLTGLTRAVDLDLGSPPVQATIDLMVRKRTALDTTAVIIEQLMMSRAGETPPSFAPVIDHLPIAYRRDARRTYMPLASPEEDQRYRQAFHKMLDVLGLLHKRGIRLLPGTDNREGFALHRELELYVMAGIPPAEVLGIATLGMARYLGRDRDHGSIEPGKKADMVLLTGDPTRDISAVRRASAVFKGGYLYRPDEIYRALNVKPFGADPAGNER